MHSLARVCCHISGEIKLCVCDIKGSTVITACTVVVQAVVKANSQSNGNWQISTPGAPKPLNRFRWNLNFLADRVKRVKCVIVPNYVAIGQSVAEIGPMAVFRFFKMATVAILVFYSVGILSFRRVKRSNAWLCQISRRSVKPRPRWRFFDFSKMAASHHLRFVMRVFGPSSKGIFITVQNLVGIDAVVLIIIHVFRFREFCLKTPIHAPKIGGGLRIWPPKWGGISTKPPKGTSVGGKDVIWRIDRQNRSTGATCARDEETKKDKERNLTVANLVFAETAHVIGSKWNFTRCHLPFPINLTIGLYNSLYYRGRNRRG